MKVTVSIQWWKFRSFPIYKLVCVWNVPHANDAIGPVPIKQPWWKRVNKSNEIIKTAMTTTTKQKTANPSLVL